MPQPLCPITNKPLPDGYAIHPACAGKLIAETSDLPELYSCVFDAKAKRLRTGTGSTHPGAPCPINLGAMDASDAEFKRIDTVWRELSVALQTTIPLSAAAVKSQMYIYADRICRLTQKGPTEDGNDWPTLGEWAYAQLMHAFKRLRTIIDRAPERAYAGPCPGCGRDTTTKLHSQLATCPACGRIWDPVAAREMMREYILQTKCDTVSALQKALLMTGHSGSYQVVHAKMRRNGLSLPISPAEYLQKTEGDNMLMISR